MIVPRHLLTDSGCEGVNASRARCSCHCWFEGEGARNVNLTRYSMDERGRFGGNCCSNCCSASVEVSSDLAERANTVAGGPGGDVVGAPGSGSGESTFSGHRHISTVARCLSSVKCVSTGTCIWR